MILIDYSGIAISSLFAMKMQVTEGMVRHMILNSLRMYNLKYREDYGRMILAIDQGTWRRDFYKEYKAHRAVARDESGFDWPELYRILDLVQNEIRENLPYYVVAVQGCEADDVIATLVESTQEFGQSEPVMIVSADHDFIQLHRHGNVKQFSNIQKALVKEKNPVLALREKVLRGDKGDGVPNILSPDDCFTAGKRQTPIKASLLENWLKNWDTLQQQMTPEVYKNFLRNQKMIDLSQIPKDRKQLVINTYVGLPKPRNNVLNYLIQKRCSNLIECAENFINNTP